MKVLLPSFGQIRDQPTVNQGHEVGRCVGPWISMLTSVASDMIETK